MTTDPQPRYDDATVDLVAGWLDPYVGMTFLGTDRDNATERILDALADAGLLLLPGTVRDAYRVVYEVGTRLVVWSEHWSRESADGGLRRGRYRYPKARMEHRREYETPWMEVPDVTT